METLGAPFTAPFLSFFPFPLFLAPFSCSSLSFLAAPLADACAVHVYPLPLHITGALMHPFLASEPHPSAHGGLRRRVRCVGVTREFREYESWAYLLFVKFLRE